MRALDDYQLLGASGLRVSPLCLGTMTFGTQWGFGVDEEGSRALFELYADRGGNYLDTANYYTQGTSEEYLGRFLSGRRERFVVGTKFSLVMDSTNPNSGGNHRKCIAESVEASLRRLQTDYIDILWLHIWEFRTPIEETMRALDDLVAQGKVLYLGISDTPAWKVAEANTLARLRGWTPFITTQIQYNLIERTGEHEIVPMAREHGLAVQPWSPLAAGLLSGKYSREDLHAPTGGDPSGTRRESVQGMGLLTEHNLGIVDAVRGVAQEAQRSCSQVALRWLMQKPGVLSPIIGARRPDQLEDNIGALEFELSSEQMERLNAASAPPNIFPNNFYSMEMVRNALQAEMTIAGGWNRE